MHSQISIADILSIDRFISLYFIAAFQLIDCCNSDNLLLQKPRLMN